MSSCNATASPKKLTSSRSFSNSPTAGICRSSRRTSAISPRRADHEAHDALLCIADGRYVVEDDRRRATPEHYFKSAAEMAALFADLPEALANTVEIAVRCAFRPEGRKPILPRFVPGDDSLSEIEQFPP